MRKPFNLVLALAGHAVVNGRGNAVEHIAYFESNNSPYKIYALIKGEESEESDEVESFTAEGKYSAYERHSDSDLFMLVPDPEKRTGYVNLWKNDDVFGILHASVHYSLEQAEAERTTSCSGKKKTLLQRLPFEYTV